MQDQSYIEEAVESAKTKLQPGERILTVGRPLDSFAMPFTKYACSSVFGNLELYDFIHASSQHFGS